MPLRKSGVEILKKFKKEYGPRLGETIFYAYMRKNKSKTKLWHRRTR